MDAFLAICQALGIGIAVGSLAGAAGLEGGARGGMTLLAAAVGLAAGALSASADDQSLLAGALPGLLGAAVACAVIAIRSRIAEERITFVRWAKRPA